MKFGGLVVVLLLVTVAIAEASITAGRSLRTRRGVLDECFSCSTEDRPFYYPLVKYFNKMKDAVVKGVNGLAETAKDYIKKLN